MTSSVNPNNEAFALALDTVLDACQGNLCEAAEELMSMSALCFVGAATDKAVAVRLFDHYFGFWLDKAVAAEEQ